MSIFFIIMMTQILTQFTPVMFIFFLAVMSPGPDLAVVTKNSISHSRQTAVYTALGVALGIWVHVAYCVMGIAFIISKSIIAFSVIKYLGAAYLIYIGIQSLRAKAIASHQTIKEKTSPKSTGNAIFEGFITNVLNPKATLFFLACLHRLLIRTPR